MKPYYERDGIAIYHGRWEDVLPRLGAGWGSPTVITDPPYDNDAPVPIRGRGVAERIEESESVANPWGYSLDWMGEVAKLQPLHWVVYCNYRMLGGVTGRFDGLAKLGCVFTWRKPNAPRMTRPVPRFDCEFIVWARSHKATCGRMGEFDSMVLDVPMPQAGCMASERIIEPGTGKALHRCQKPIAVVQPFVDRLSPVTDFVLDLFMGTGTTLRAAKLAGVRAVGIEQEERYCEVAAKTLAQGVLFGAGGAA